MMQRLAITGAGVVSPFGVGLEAWRLGYRSENAAARAFTGGTLTAVSSANQVSGALAEAWGFDPKAYLGDKGIRNFDRLTKFLLVAAREALENAGVKKGDEFIALDASRVGVCSATAYGSLDAITELDAIALKEDPRYINPSRFPNTVVNSSAGYVSIRDNLQGPNATLVDGNCGALNAVLTSATWLATGAADGFVVGGGEALSDALVTGFSKLGLLADANAKFAPGAPESDGTRLAEGACFLMMEREKDARARGADVRGVVSGFGSAFGPPEREDHLTGLSSSVVARALRGALADASLSPGDIQLVVSNASGLPFFDAAELAAIDEVFGRNIAVTAPKGDMGETLGASGAFGILAALEAISNNSVKVVRGANPSAIKRAIVVSTGFYGNVSAVLVEA